MKDIEIDGMTFKVISETDLQEAKHLKLLLSVFAHKDSDIENAKMKLYCYHTSRRLKGFLQIIQPQERELLGLLLGRASKYGVRR